MEGQSNSIAEEIANSVSHGLGAALCIAGLILLILRAASAGGTRAIVCCAVFGASAVLLYLSSTLYHSLGHTGAHRVLRALDHGSIYLLIAGTYTPFTLLGLRGALGWTLFGIVWSCALVGVIIKIFAAGRWGAISTAVYLAMGWTCLLAIKSMYQLLPRPVFVLLLAGGLCYSLGIPFFASRRKYMHLLWHLWVLAGTACHFLAIWLLVR
jgi:hemolysin III